MKVLLGDLSFSFSRTATLEDFIHKQTQINDKINQFTLDGLTNGIQFIKYWPDSLQITSKITFFKKNN